MKDILPDQVPCKTYLVEARHISPYYSGHVEMRFNGEGIQFRWYGETVWAEMMTWAELAFKAGIRNEQYLDDLRAERQDAYNKGYQEGLETARKGATRDRSEDANGRQTSGDTALYSRAG